MSKFVIIAYYTDDSIYEEAADQLKKHLPVLGVPFIVEKYRSKRQWVLNTGIKPQFILHCLKTMDYDTLMYVDVDTAFKRYPTFVDDWLGDLAIHKIRNVEIARHLILFRNNDTTRALVERWCAQQQESPMISDQINLARVIGREIVYPLPSLDPTISHKFLSQTFTSLPRKGRMFTPPDPTNAKNVYLHEVVKKDAWKGQRCFILGGGPSLNTVNLDRLRGELVIGVNRAFERYDGCFNYSMDTRFLNWVKSGILDKERFEASRATKVWLRESGTFEFPADSYIIDRNGKMDLSIDAAKGFGQQDNSGFGALNLALYLGASPIYLLGFDMNNEPNKTQTWWHNGYPIVASSKVYERFQSTFERLAPAIEAEVINLNPNSGLKCFKFGDMDSLSPTPERPIVVSYYTKNTSYEDEIKTMIESAHRMGFVLDVEGIDTLGGWQANTYYKARFLRRKLEQHAPTPILWLDADVIVRQYPTLFDNLNADVAVNIVDWSKYPNVRRNDKELNTSVVFLRPTEAVFALLDAWIAENDKRQSSGVWEQKVFQDVLERHKDIRLRVLPDNYCQIFDKMQSAGYAVIELFQASRRFKREVGA